jgi:hypothetical protein
MKNITNTFIGTILVLALGPIFACSQKGSMEQAVE